VKVKKALSYKDAGVNIKKADLLVDSIKSMARTTFRPEVVSSIGGFSGLFALRAGTYRKPVLSASTDGVGTKLKIAFMMDKHDTVGIDLVAMGVNDILTQGAEPLFFLDYIATGELKPKTVEAIIRGVSNGCKQAGCALLGGEMAEMPSFYAKNEYDLAGFAVGVVEERKIIDGSAIKTGDVLVGIASSGLHSNGFSLVRKVLLEQCRLRLGKKIAGTGRPLGEELLEPTLIYVRPVLDIIRKFRVHGMAHITGGGLIGNIPRILPSHCRALIRKKSWTEPPIFSLLREKSGIAEMEMLKTFNCGIGMVLVVPRRDADAVRSRLRSHRCTAYTIGEITERPKGGKPIVII